MQVALENGFYDCTMGEDEILAYFSLPMIYCCKTSRIVDNRKHIGLFNERKKFFERHLMKADILVRLA